MSRSGSTIPSSYSRIVARELNLQERNLDGLLRGTGLAVDILLPGDETLITGRQQLQILQNASQISAQPGFGLRLGTQLQPSAHGPLGYLAQSSPNLLQGLEALKNFLPVRIPFVELELSLDDEWLCCVFTIKLEADDTIHTILRECFALTLQALAEAILGTAGDQALIEMEHAEPAYADQYGKYLRAAVQFSCPRTIYRIPAAEARLPSLSQDPEAFALAWQHCNRLLEQVPGELLSTSDRVRRMMLSSPAVQVNETDVARAMFITKRTLARRLEREGHSYRGIRERVLAELASRHLAEPGLTVESVACLLGYNDAAAFRKAFRRWYAQSPSEFRSSRMGASAH